MYEYLELDGAIYRILKYINHKGMEIATLVEVEEGGECDEAY